ncbi:Heme chaperone HemW OS=Streptomyces violarus OX=67380 GN=FHS41_003526 PE=3 SV=1 [Streptomyces violarus]
MQSAEQHVLKILDRTHTPGRPEACVAEARAAGFDHVNLDLIYGTPGESDDDWRASLDAALGAGPDHVSAYALIVEEGTQLARRIRRGEVPMTDDDVHADRYLIAEEALSRGGFRLVRGVQLGHLRGRALPAQRAVLAARRTGGARAPAPTPTSAGVRWRNVQAPGAYARRARRRAARPAPGREVLTRRGPPGGARPAGAAAPRRLSRSSLLKPEAGLAASRRALDGRAAAGRSPTRSGRAVLTLRGRLLADAVVRDLVD